MRTNEYTKPYESCPTIATHKYGRLAKYVNGPVIINDIHMESISQSIARVARENGPDEAGSFAAWIINNLPSTKVKEDWSDSLTEAILSAPVRNDFREVRAFMVCNSAASKQDVVRSILDAVKALKDNGEL